MNTLGKGLLTYGFQYPTCLQNGAHRYSVPKSVGKDRKTWFSRCRLCSETRMMTFDVEKGQIVEKIIKASTPAE